LVAIVQTWSWKRRLLAGWIVFTVCWVFGWGWYYNLPSCGVLHAGETADIGWHCDGPLGSIEGYEIVPLFIMAMIIVGVPIAVFCAGVAIRFLLSPARD
jgi:hypothetical protein